MALISWLGPALVALATGRGPTAPTPVTLDFRDRTIAQVVRALNDRTGGAVGLDGINDPRWNEARVTLESPRPVPLIEAVDRLGVAGGLNVDPVMGGPNGQAPHFGLRSSVSGSVEAAAVVYTGPFRLGPVAIDERFERVFLPGRPGTRATDRDHPACRAEIPMMAEPALIWAVAGRPKDLEAVDDLGQSWLAPAESGPAEARPGEPVRFGVGKPIRIGLARPARPGTRLATLRGVLPIEVARRSADPAAAVVVPLAGATGQTLRASGLAVEVREVRVGPQGLATLQLRVGVDGPAGARGSGLIEALSDHLVDVLDAQGRPLPVAGQFSAGRAGRVLTYNPPPPAPGTKGTSPARVRIVRADRAAWDLPFAFRDVPIP